ncbi:SOS response-associated peptidase [Pseudonocardiaceae bacterium YIM PH 21723]|nr:SOS response-associated peptidase [Pseudonocardiaceae bacterium YIM PH 21723]
MCGRYSAKKDPATLATEFDAIDATDGATGGDYNVAPTKQVAAVVQRHPRDAEGKPDESRTERTVRMMRWGLVPSWAKDIGMAAKMINARSETAAEKPAYRTSMKKYRCLMPADGWYEWKVDSGSKQPYFIKAPGEESLALAALWAVWRDPAEPQAGPLISCSVLTADSVGQLENVHHRMPVLLPRSKWADWLDPDREDATDVLAEPDLDLLASLQLIPVSTMVNNVRNNGPQLWEPAQEDGLFSL